MSCHITGNPSDATAQGKGSCKMGNFITAWRAFWRILVNRDAARDWRQLSEGKPHEIGEEPEAEPRKPAAAEHGDAVYTLVLLQRSGRLVDFLQEDIGAYSDEQVGAAVRQIHSSCAAALREHFGIEPVMREVEESIVTVPAGFDPSTIQLTGKVKGEPPFEGKLRHRGWKAGEVKLPQRSSSLDPTVICPAEVEL